ncbi:MAG: UDP-glucose 4-epimerase GalE [Spirochaetales bacterium]|nr:UDP-glucose 4-epimerase GalE [Spirochaetales bacterium]
MNILVVGGAGYIGSHVCLAFADRGDQVTIFDNFSSGSRINIPKGMEVVEGDILNTEDLKAIFSRKWDGVVHLAAFKAAGESMVEPEKYSVNNITGTLNLLNAMAAHGAPPLVFSSSAAIFGEPAYLPIDEDHPKAPENYYGFTKLEIERFLDWYDRLRGLRSAALRYFNAAGYDPQGRITEPERSPQNLLPILMEAAAGMRDSVTVFGDDYPTPDGTCIRDYVHVSDLANAHVKAMDYLIREDKSLKVNLGSESGISVAEMVEKAVKISQVDFSRSMGARRAGDPANLVATSQLARDLLDWTPQYSDAESLLSTTWKVYSAL